jgi:predicted nucleic acid-binding protein
MLYAVIDTNVLFEGLTKTGGVCGLIVDAWSNGVFVSCVSNALALEYADVLSRKLSQLRWRAAQPVLSLLLDSSIEVEIYYSWRPQSPDASDDRVIDCAMNAGAPIVTYNIRHFTSAMDDLGLLVWSPAEFLLRLDETEDSNGGWE